MAEKLSTLELDQAPRPRIDFGWVILNSYGNVWHDGLFETPPEAHAYLRDSWPRDVLTGQDR